MRLRFYWHYATRSLRRGGQRTVLAVFCIAVGVMAIVALQLASEMVSNNLIGNVRQANGGDISVHQDIVPLQQADVQFFRALRREGRATGVAAFTRDRGVAYHVAGSYAQSESYPVIIGVVDPREYPLVGEPDFTQPADGNLHRLLARAGDTVLSTTTAARLHAHLGDQVTVSGSAGRTLTLRVVGLVGEGGLSGGVDVYAQRSAYAAAGDVPLVYNTVYLTTASDAQARGTATYIRSRYPLANVETVQDALQQRIKQTALVHQLLQVVGILALLIGGFGVVNTMNVLLARRRTEIAMLKTAGYRRRDLYALFGVEGALLGLLGGVGGAVAGIALSAGVKSLIEKAFLLRLPFIVDPFTVASGVGVGFCTAVIFGLVPIVRATFVRPQAVLRDVPERVDGKAWAGIAGLGAALSLLFFVLAGVIMGSALWGAIVVYGTGTALIVLGILFWAFVALIGRFPVPERPTVGYALAALFALLAALAVARVEPAAGIPLAALAALAVAVAFLPRAWKATLRMSLRNAGRQRARATMTLLALFVGVFCVGLMVVLGQDVRDKIQAALAGLADFNVASVVPIGARGQVDAGLRHLPGLERYEYINAYENRATDIAVNGRPLLQILLRHPASRRPGRGNLGFNGTLALLSGFGGYDLGRQPTQATIARGDGRDLTRTDARSANVLLDAHLHTLGPLHLRVGDRLSLPGVAGSTAVTVRVVGFYSTGPFGDLTHFEPILASRLLVSRLGGSSQLIIYSVKVDPKRTDAAVAQLNVRAPRAITINLTTLGVIVDEILGNLIILLVALASLALFAGVIIIANAVALAMLEQRREQGILKAMGYTSGRVLASVLLENGVIGCLAGVLGMLVVAIATAVLAQKVFNTSLSVPGSTAVALVALVVVIALATAGLVAWQAVRVRPLDVLRYE